MSTERYSAWSGISFREADNGGQVMIIKKVEEVDIENFADALMIAIESPNTEEEIKRGIKTPQYHMTGHAAELCKRFGFDQSQRQAWFSENKEKIRQMAVYFQGLIEATSNPLPVMFLAKLIGKKLVDDDENLDGDN